MIKKILLMFVLLFGLFSISSSYVYGECEEWENCAEVGDLDDIGSNPNDLSSSSFTIDTKSILPVGTDVEGTGKEAAKSLVVTITEKLMIGLGVISLLVMTIGGGYMVLYHGQDELLSKGKSIFMAGIIALIVALSSSILVKVVASVLFTN